jgi:competence protein ComEC
VLAGSLCAGLAASHTARIASPLLAAAGVVGALGAAVASGRARVAALALSLALAGWWWGSVRLDALDASVLAAYEGESARAVVVVTGPVRRGSFALRMPAEVRRFGRLAPDEDVLLRLPLGRAPPQGAILELIGRIEQPRPSGEGFDERTWLRRQGVSVLIEGARWRVVGRRGGLGGVADRLRRHLEKTSTVALAGDRRAVVAGIVVGADEGLTRELQDAFRASGLYHLLAVSGQNVAYIAIGVLAVAWAAGIPRRLAEVGILASIASYVLAVGWQPSVVRAGIAGALASLAWLAARPLDRWYAMLVGAGVLLGWNPYALFEPGFQLSFAAVAAIFVAVPRLERVLDGYPLPGVIAGSMALSAACGVATAPIVWLHFGAVPTYAVPANALVAPAVPPLLGLGLAAAAVEPVAAPVADALSWTGGWLAAYVAGCARLVAAAPGSQLSSASALAVLATLVVLGVLVARLDRPRRRRLLSGVAATAVAAAGWQLTPEEPVAPPRGVRITVLDVGQGDATLVESAAGAILVDEGPPEARVAEQLRRLGLRRLALLVLTHPSRDNIGGAEDVVRRLDVDLLLHAALPFDDPYGPPAIAEARRRGVDVRVARAGQTYRLGALRLAVLWPPDGRRRSDDPNDHATVLLVSFGAVDVLLPADAEGNVLVPLRLPDVEILKVSHHGSRDASLPELVERITPQVALVSIGADNEYGHPAPSTLAALGGVPIYRTDLHGRIVVESDGREVRVRTQH